MVSGHAIPHHLYADDSQLYVSFASGDSATARDGLQSCLASVQSWMSRNKLILNQIKLNSSLSGTNDSRANISQCFLLRFVCPNQPSKFCLESLSNFDKNVTFRWHTSTVCSSCFYHIQDLGCICCYLDLNSAKLLANAKLACLY